VRTCSLLRWLQGRFSPSRIGLPHYRAQGRLMARMHQFSAGWDHPLAAAKRRWDWNGLFGDVEGTEMAAGEIWPLIPAEYVRPFETVIERTGQVMAAWGTGPDVYGLIHADLGVDANLLFWRGEARAIDFDDSGFGYWIYDLAVSLEHVRDDSRYPEIRDGLLGGYAELRALPEAQVAEIELFLAAFYVYLSFWCAAMTVSYPHYWEELMERLERAAGLATRYVATL
jgi:Ser/Thr protein kinase RdoA (MazF antagonist)